jgi:integrase
MSTFLLKSRKAIYSRVTIPKALRKYFGERVEVWRSCRTLNKEEASCRSLKWKAEAKRLFRTLRQHGGHMKKEQIETLVSNWLEAELDYAEDCRALAGPMSDDERESQLDGLGIMFDEAHEALLGNDYRRIESDADALIKAAGFPPMDHDSADFGRLCRRLLRAKIKYTRIETDRWNGEYLDDHFNRSATVSRHRTVDGAIASSQSSPLFSVVLEKYLAVNTRPVRTAKPLKAELLKFIQTIGGDRPIASITKTDAVSYKESLQQVRRVSVTTAIKHISNADAFFKWAEAHTYIPEGTNLMKGLTPSKRQARKQALKRRPFTDEELLVVFGSVEFLSQHEKRPERYWLALLLLFECCRREEAAQLYLKDIGENAGVPFIQITDEELDQSLKNEGSKRRVPIHSSLIQLGFMEYVDSIKRGGHKRLFPQLKSKGNNGYGDPVGKWWGRMVRDLGLTDPRLVIHSLRHGGITKLHSAGVPRNIAEILTGHSAGNVHEDYIHKELISLKTLQEGLEKLQYPEVVKRLSGSSPEDSLLVA